MHWSPISEVKSYEQNNIFKKTSYVQTAIQDPTVQQLVYYLYL